jgi:hypothetical protein
LFSNRTAPVNAERDRPPCPHADDVERLRQDPVVAAFLDGKPM